MTPKTYVLEVSDEINSVPSRIKSIQKLFNDENTIVTLNLIREVFGLRPLRSEYEMCFGPNTEEPLDISVSYSFNTRMHAENNCYTIKISNVIDLRYFYECCEESDYYGDD